MAKSIGMAEGLKKKPATAKGTTSKAKRKIRSVEIETAANGWEIECRFKQPKGDGPTSRAPSTCSPTQRKPARSWRQS